MGCLFHKWDGCRCSRCGELRDTRHYWAGCRCRTCGKQRDEGHEWNGCTCRICGKRRNEGHDWNGCTCRICGKRREDAHEWIWTAANQSIEDEYCFQQCRYCGKTRGLTHHDYQPVPGESAQICIRCGHLYNPSQPQAAVSGPCIPVHEANNAGEPQERKPAVSAPDQRIKGPHTHRWEEIPGSRVYQVDRKDFSCGTYQKRCAVCGATETESFSHYWEDA